MLVSDLVCSGVEIVSCDLNVIGFANDEFNTRNYCIRKSGVRIGPKGLDLCWADNTGVYVCPFLMLSDLAGIDEGSLNQGGTNKDELSIAANFHLCKVQICLLLYKSDCRTI